MKKIFFLLLAIFFTVPVFGFSMQVGKFGFFKGEELSVSGSCESAVLIRASLGEKEIFSRQADCANNSYLLRQKIPFLFPSGEILITAAQGNLTETKTILVRSTRESAFLSISIASPTQRGVARAETVNLSVSVSDAGNPAENAVVQSWGLDGKPLELVSTAPGVFTAAVPIPFDAALEDWNILVTAQAEDAEGIEGGELSFSVPIIEAPLVLEIESPAGQNLSTLKKILFRVKAQYQNGSPLENPVVLLQLQDKNIRLEPKEPGFFETTLEFSSQQAGIQKFLLFAADSSQNKASKEISFFVADDFQSQFFSVLPFLLSAAVLIAIVALIVVPRVRKQKTATGMQKRKKEIEQELVSLQKGYFEKNILSKESFQQKSVSLGQELEEINKKLNTPKK